MTGHETYDLGDVVLQSGRTLRDAKLAYTTFGELNDRRDNAIVFPTFFGSQHDANEPMIGAGMALDPGEYFIVVPNLFGNGLSSSPSNTPPPNDGPRFPATTYHDNIVCQHQLLTERLEIERVAIACGFSMGAQQSYHWGALYPDMVKRIAPWCGSARTSRHNFVFLEGAGLRLRPTPSGTPGGIAPRPPECCGRWPGCTPDGGRPRPSTGRRSIDRWGTLR